MDCIRGIAHIQRTGPRWGITCCKSPGSAVLLSFAVHTSNAQSLIPSTLKQQLHRQWQHHLCKAASRTIFTPMGF